MNTFNALELIPTIAAIRVEVLRNREACNGAVALRAHDTLIAKLDEITADLNEEVATEQRLAAEKGTQDGDAWYEIHHICTPFECRWVEAGAISVLDLLHEDVVFEGETCRVGLMFTIVPDAELEGLADILDTIRRETGIEFVAARV